MDFYNIAVKRISKDKFEVYPDYIVDDSQDLMIRGGKFYAVWDEGVGLWSTKEIVVPRMIDKEIREKVLSMKTDGSTEGASVIGRYLRNDASTMWKRFRNYCNNLPDNYHQLDEKLTFQDTKVEKTDYVSKRLPYCMKKGEMPAWEQLISTLYEPEERQKIEWAIGSILSGDSKRIQKFLLFYGPQGSGKSTILNIVKKLFDGYCAKFDAKGLVTGNNAFILESFKDNPLVSIDEDTNLSRIEDNAVLNTIVSHEPLRMNEKFKSTYEFRPTSFLMMGTNQPVKITDAKSGIIRRLIDVEPSGRKIRPERKYDELISQIDFELGAIAWHCLHLYKKMGRTYYSDYIPTKMMYRTDPFFNFMEDKAPIFLRNGGCTANELWSMYKDWCDDSGVDFRRKRFEVIEEAKNYFRNYEKIARVDGKQVRSWFSDIRMEKFQDQFQGKEEGEETVADLYEPPDWLKLDCEESILDKELAECPAQYPAEDGSGRLETSWRNCRTKLKDIDTHKVHHVLVPEELITIDFDLKDKDGNKDPQANLRMAGQLGLKPTYAELSKSGGLHLEYYYDGDVSKLSHMLYEDVEIKVFPYGQLGSLRRKVSKCNTMPVAHISSGLPLKTEKVIDKEAAKDDKHLRNRILMAIRKEVKPGATVTCVNYIDEELKKAQAAGMSYDIRDLADAIYSLAASSHHHAKECIDKYYSMEFMWPKEEEQISGEPISYAEDAPTIVLDVESWPNLFLIVYKELEPDGVAAVYKDPDKCKPCRFLFNPNPHEVENLFNMKIIGFNNLNYDNSMLYGCYLGNTPEEQQRLSEAIIKGSQRPFKEAKKISYTDVYDYSSEKKSLKKFEIEMHLPHQEMETDWSKPLPEELWQKAADYCKNDVLATEAVHLSKERQGDFKARQILAALTGMTVNDTTNNLTAQLIFGDDWEPQKQFIYPNLHEKFPEYEFKNGKSYFNGVLIGEGGRVFADPNIWYDVTCYDVSGMHPSSEIAENGFGPIYTPKYQDLYEARIAIKHKDYDKASKMFGGKLAPYLTNKNDAKDLSRALKIALNSVYGMTAAHFKNRFRDERNIDNWVAKRGACFIEKLRLEATKLCEKYGAHVVHVKTDSIKIAKTCPEIEKFIMDFGKKYGYTFEIESHYERMALVNNAVYIALRAKDDPSWTDECAKAKEKGLPEPTRWTATGAQFAHPFVFKKLFSKEKMDFWDYCEIKTVQTAMYLDMNENLPNVEKEEKDLEKLQKRRKMLAEVMKNRADPQYEQAKAEYEDLAKDEEILNEIIAKGHSYYFIGKAGSFCPVRPGLEGGLLKRKGTNGRYDYVAGAKGYRWLEAEALQKIPDCKNMIDMNYFRDLADTAIETINKFGSFELFVRGEEHILDAEERITDFADDGLPWSLPCGTEQYAHCSDCPEFSDEHWGYCCKLGYNIENTILPEKEKQEE